MNIGYACLTIGVPETAMKSCLQRNAAPGRLQEIITHNINSLENMIDYNIKNNIKLFRISSDLIPFGSSPVNDLPWWDIFASRFEKIGNKIDRSGMRVSMHPGQYTILNSNDKEVVIRAIDDLSYHTRILDCLGADSRHKIIIHIGGVYNDKDKAVKRFKTVYKDLPEAIKNRLVIENDDRLYNISDVLEIGECLNIPVVFDNLHNKINPSLVKSHDLEWIMKCRKTWNENDGCQKIHYSQQDPSKNPGSHSASIRINEFMDYYRMLEKTELDIMLEVKDKNLSAVKCINCTSGEKNITLLEQEWSRYKYRVLETSPREYLEIRELLQDKTRFDAVPFYSFIESALAKESNMGNSINAAQHVWGYFKKDAEAKEKAAFAQMISACSQGKKSIRSVKNFLYRMAVKYQQKYLLDSYYFIIE